MVLLGFRTVLTGERAVIRSHTGEIRVVDGPARLTLWRSKLHKLVRHIAGPDQYLEIKMLSGATMIRPGPCSEYFNPYEHSVIAMNNAIFVEAGEAVVIYKSMFPMPSPMPNGSVGNNGTVGKPKSSSPEKRIKHGPLRYVPEADEMVEQLVRHLAGQGEYLLVQDIHGNRSILPGPCSIFFDPIEHTSITKKAAIFVNAGQAIVVYRSHSTEKIKEVDRLILHGPIQYIPQPNEWTHDFAWHGPDPDNKTHFTCGTLRFTKLTTIADQIYYNVREVRTKDDTLLRVKLMIFFELKDIEKMLDNTHDPIGDFINAAASDVVAFCAQVTYEEFLSRTTQLNDLETFGQLTKRAGSIGYDINKVVFRGFHASDALQAMHDTSIQERTRLKLETDTEMQRQSHLDLQLSKEEERASRQARLEMEALRHKQALEDSLHHKEMEREEARHAQRMAFLDAEHERQQRRLQGMKTLDVDVTKVLVAEQRAPDKHLKIDGAGDRVILNLHEDNDV